MRPLRRSLTVLGLAALVGLSAASPVHAAYPGQNGKIFFHSCGDPCATFDVYSINPDGTGLDNLTDQLTGTVGTPDNAFDPSVSANGNRVAFGVDSQATSEIWIMNANGSNPLRLTNDNLLDQQPAISPDGTRVAWNQWSPFPSYTDADIWVMGSNGTNPELLFNGFGTDTFPQFTPDGQTMVMTAETGDRDVRKIPSIPADPPLTTATGLAEDDALLEAQPSVSPDGARVAFTQETTAPPTGPFDIYSVSINGGLTTPLFDDATASETFPAYSPDGAKIVFNSDGVPMVGNADGSGTPAPLDVGTLTSVGNFDWAPRQASPPAPPGPTSPPPQAPEPSNEFNFGKAKKNKRRGTAKLTVEVPGAGLLELARTKKVKGTEQTATAAGEVVLSVKPTRKATKALVAKGRAKVVAEVTFTPQDGEANTLSKGLRLVRKTGR